MVGEIIWLSDRVLFGKCIILFCFGEKCMSGKIYRFEEMAEIDRYKIWVEFIEPEYFKDYLFNSSVFTINEVKVVLATGKVIS